MVKSVYTCDNCSWSRDFDRQESHLIGVKCPNCGNSRVYADNLVCPTEDNYLSVHEEDINKEDGKPGSWLVDCDNHQNKAKKHDWLRLRVAVD